MLTLLSVLGVLAVLFVAAAVATSDAGALADAPPDASDLDLPAGPLAAADVRGVRFGLTLRGYRMSEVDEVLARLADDLAGRERDAGAGDDGSAGTAPG